MATTKTPIEDLAAIAPDATYIDVDDHVQLTVVVDGHTATTVQESPEQAATVILEHLKTLD